jgi:protein-S-isoprenylcysteine O-methyltransferase Ste14
MDYPFWRQRRARPKRESLVIAPAARWGIFLESLSYALVRFYVDGAVHPGIIRIVASLSVAVFSTALVWSAVRYLGRQWRIQAGLFADHQLVSTGPYRMVRHPIYVSMFGMLIATGLLMTPTDS